MTRPALNDKQIARMAFRIAMFQRRGLSERAAEKLADRLADRDDDRDDRRVCLECEHLQRSGACFAAAQGWLPHTSPRHAPVPDLLQRCERFSFQTP
jgi:hypothetical protein